MKKILVVITALLISFSFSLNTASALEANISEKDIDEQAEELADILEFVFEEAGIEDEHGNLVNIDTDKVEEKFGKSPELDSLKEAIKKEENSIQPMINPDGPNGKGAEMRKCTDAKIKNEWKEYLGDATGASIINAVLSKNYKKGAKLLIKKGVKGSLAGIVYTLGKHQVQCALTV